MRSHAWRIVKRQRLTGIVFGETRADTLAMLEELVGAVLHAGALYTMQAILDQPCYSSEQKPQRLTSLAVNALLVKSWAQLMKHRSTRPE